MSNLALRSLASAVAISKAAWPRVEKSVGKRILAFMGGLLAESRVGEHKDLEMSLAIAVPLPRKRCEWRLLFRKTRKFGPWSAGHAHPARTKSALSRTPCDKAAHVRGWGRLVSDVGASVSGVPPSGIYFASGLETVLVSR